MKYIKTLFKSLIFFIPLLIGVCGFYALEHEPFLDAVFNSIRLYLFNYSDHPANMLIEIARWTAPLMTASGVILIFNQIKEQLNQFFIYLSGKSTALVGPSEQCALFVEELAPYVIHLTDDSFVKASRYLLMDTEENNFSWIQTYKKELADTPVYLKCSSLSSQSSYHPHLHLFCIEEIASRLYWKKNFLYPISKGKHHHLKIVIIGWNKLAEELLLSALQNNIFSPDQQYLYQIIGNGDEFMHQHTSLNHVTDQIEFINEPWHHHLQMIEQADLVLITEQKEQLKLVNDMLFSLTNSEMTVFAARSSELHLLSGTHRLNIFDWKKESLQSEYIFQDTLYKNAKSINLRYAHLNSSVPETSVQMELEWSKLDAFTRGSNISSADYHEIRCKMLKADNLSEKELFSSHLELYSELEHIRWCRYHVLNNWKYGIPENGKNKDAVKRIHSLLIPYSQLSEAEKDKDRENLRVLHSIKQ